MTDNEALAEIKIHVGYIRTAIDRLSKDAKDDRRIAREKHDYLKTGQVEIRNKLGVVEKWVADADEFGDSMKKRFGARLVDGLLILLIVGLVTWVTGQ